MTASEKAALNRKENTWYETIRSCYEYVGKTSEVLCMEMGGSKFRSVIDSGGEGGLLNRGRMQWGLAAPDMLYFFGEHLETGDKIAGLQLGGEYVKIMWY